MEEVWRDIQDYKGYYQVSNLGRIKSLPRYRKNGNGGYIAEEKILKQTKTTTGYYKVELKVNNKRKSLKVHRLVAKAFIPNTEDKPNINHIDGNPLNNIYTNLEWCTQKENVNHAIEIGLKQCIAIDEKELKHYYIDLNMGVKEIARIYGISHIPVMRNIKKYGIKRKESGGQIKYKITREMLKENLKNKTCIQLANEIGCTRGLVYHYINVYNLRGEI